MSCWGHAKHRRNDSPFQAPAHPEPRTTLFHPNPIHPIALQVYPPPSPTTVPYRTVPYHTIPDFTSIQLITEYARNRVIYIDELEEKLSTIPPDHVCSEVAQWLLTPPDGDGSNRLHECCFQGAYHCSGVVILSAAPNARRNAKRNATRYGAQTNPPPPTHTHHHHRRPRP